MNLTTLPENLPVPIDDGKANHLLQSTLPDISLSSTSHESVNIGSIPGLLVLFIYPMTGDPNTPLPKGWDEIPGARGCTPQACSFSDNYTELQSHQVSLYGMSSQTTNYQSDAKKRLELPYDLLSDNSLKLKSAMTLPTFKVSGMELYKRLTLIANDGEIKKVFYPVFPPNKNVDEVLDWITENVK